MIMLENIIFITKNHFEIFQNIETFFINNNSSLENHYEAIKIKNSKLKGIYLYSSSSRSMEEDILYFF